MGRALNLELLSIGWAVLCMEAAPTGLSKWVSERPLQSAETLLEKDKWSSLPFFLNVTPHIFNWILLRALRRTFYDIHFGLLEIVLHQETYVEGLSDSSDSQFAC